MYVVMIAGVPFQLIINGDGEYISAVGQNISAAGSPLVITINQTSANFGDIYQFILKALAEALLNGAYFV